eukprot:m.73250 g.73250  ORF g.73250 m.73250 type:complete len:194 (-) comp50293_c0_seq3:35-616(-)
MEGLEDIAVDSKTVLLTESLQRAIDLKALATQAFQEGDFRVAKRKFHEALLQVKSISVHSTSMHALTGQAELPLSAAATAAAQEGAALRIILANNLALVHLKEQNWPRVIALTTEVLEISPRNEKAVIRRAKAHFELKQYIKAEEDLALARDINPAGGDAECARMEGVLRQWARDCTDKERDRLKKMFQKLAI